MKATTSICRTLAVIILACTACTKRSNPAPGLGGIQIDLDQKVIDLSVTRAVYATGSGGFQVVAQNGTPATIQLTIPQNFTIGTFDIASGKAQAVYTASTNNGTVSYTGTAGSVVVTTYTTYEVQGIFSFTGTDPSGNSFAVDSGRFNTGYSQVRSLYNSVVP